MGDYFKAYKIAQNFGGSETTVEDWCREGHVSGTFKVENLWLIPRDITVVDIDPPMMEYSKDVFQD